MTESDHWQQLIDFVIEQRGRYRKPLTRETDLLDGLGIDGDDAVEFLEAFAKRFDCDLHDLDLRQYFNGEGLDVIGAIISLFRKTEPLKPITLGMPEDAIARGTLST